MAKSGEFYTFDEVVRQLKIDENKLKRLVSEGEISAFREGDVMKFKKTEIDKLAKKGAGSETSETVLSEITLEDEAPVFEESGETLTDDLVFEGAGGSDEVRIGSDEAGLKTQEISSQDTFIEEARGGDVGMTTEPIDLSADLTPESEEEEEEVAAPARAKISPGRSRAAREQAAPAGSPGLTFALVLTAVVALFGFYLSYRVSHNEIGPEANPLGDGVARGLSNIVYENMGFIEDVKKARDALVQPINAAHGAARTGASGG
ncbi:MAG: helix-turn-helix domain-containing protein [Planctomycetota bacterium]